MCTWKFTVLRGPTSVANVTSALNKHQFYTTTSGYTVMRGPTSVANVTGALGK